MSSGVQARDGVAAAREDGSRGRAETDPCRHQCDGDSDQAVGGGPQQAPGRGQADAPRVQAAQGASGPAAAGDRLGQAARAARGGPGVQARVLREAEERVAPERAGRGRPAPVPGRSRAPDAAAGGEEPGRPRRHRAPTALGLPPAAPAHEGLPVLPPADPSQRAHLPAVQG